MPVSRETRALRVELVACTPGGEGQMLEFRDELTEPDNQSVAIGRRDRDCDNCLRDDLPLVDIVRSGQPQRVGDSVELRFASDHDVVLCWSVSGRDAQRATAARNTSCSRLAASAPVW